MAYNPEDCSCLRDLMIAVDIFRRLLDRPTAELLHIGGPFYCKMLDSVLDPNGRWDKPGVYVFVDGNEVECKDDAIIAYVGKCQQKSGIIMRVIDNHREYKLDKNKAYPVKHCFLLTVPRELHFLVPALEAFLIDKLKTRDNFRKC